MKKHTKKFIFIVAISIYCLTLNSCTQKPDFGLVFSAFDPESNMFGVFQINDGEKEIKRIYTYQHNFQRIFLEDVSSTGKTILVKNIANLTEKNKEGDQGLGVYTTEGDNALKQVVALPQGINIADLSPDETKIALIDASEHFSSLWVGNYPDFNAEEAIEVGTSVWWFGIAWSPNGKEIAYQKAVKCLANCSKYKLYSEIHIVDISTLKDVKITDVSLSCIQPKWSQTAKWIAVNCVNPDFVSSTLVLVSSDGKQMHSVIGSGKNGASVYDYAWSPNGKWISYIERVGNEFSIYIFNPDRNQIKKIPINLLNNLTEIRDIAWTPDGLRLIAITSNWQNVKNKEGKSFEQIVVTNLDGSNQQIITSTLEDINNLFVINLR